MRYTQHRKLEKETNSRTSRHRTEGRARGGAENRALLPKFVFSTMLFLIFIMKIKKEIFGFLITKSSLRPRTEGSMRLCVMKFQKIPLNL